jgi:hypothetical protein
MRFRPILLASLFAAIAANLTAFVAWEVADGAENVQYFLQRTGAVAAVLAGATVTLRTRGAWHEAVSAGLFTTVLSYGLTWVPVFVSVLLNPPS